MNVMPANATGWFWHCLARETGRLGHLFSPGAQRGPWPWFPYALDNGAFSCWDRARNEWDEDKWQSIAPSWWRLIDWARSNTQKPEWVIVPDVIGDAERTLRRYSTFAGLSEFPLALAVQDGMTPADVRKLTTNPPQVICVGGTDDFKKNTWREWTENFPRVHVLRVNSPKWLYELEEAGVESCDGTGWNRGDKNQTAGLEQFLRSHPLKGESRMSRFDLWPYVCRDKSVRGSGQTVLL